MSLRDLITEYILFAFDEHELLALFHINGGELLTLSDVDLLEIYDQTLLMDPKTVSS